MCRCIRPSVLVTLPITQEASFSLAATSTSGTTARSSVSDVKRISADNWKYLESSFKNRRIVPDVTYCVQPDTLFLVLTLTFRPVASIVQPTNGVFTACQIIMQIIKQALFLFFFQCKETVVLNVPNRCRNCVSAMQTYCYDHNFSSNLIESPIGHPQCLKYVSVETDKVDADCRMHHAHEQNKNQENNPKLLF